MVTRSILMFALNSVIAAQTTLTTSNTVITESDDDCDGSCPLPEDGDETVAADALVAMMTEMLMAAIAHIIA